MLKAQSKAILDIFYRLLSSPVPATDIDGTISPANLPGSVTGDLDGARLMDGTVTMAKLGADVTMIKNIQRCKGTSTASTTFDVAITTVDMSKSCVIGSMELGQGRFRIKDETHVEIINGNGSDNDYAFEIVEFI